MRLPWQPFEVGQWSLCHPAPFGSRQGGREACRFLVAADLSLLRTRRRHRVARAKETGNLLRPVQQGTEQVGAQAQPVPIDLSLELILSLNPPSDLAGEVDLGASRGFACVGGCQSGL